MDRHISKNIRGRRRQQRVRRKVRGTATQPRLTVFRSNLHMYAQIVDDLAGETLVAASTAGKARAQEKGGNVAAAVRVGTAIAEAAKAKGITQVAFDRGPYRYHGRVKALADAARAAGLKF